MKKAEIQTLMQRSKRLRTDKLTAAKAAMTTIIEERELTKGMYFWTPGCSASERRWHEKNRNLIISVNLTGCCIHYARDYQESCRNVYASDELSIIIGDEKEKITIADLKKMIAEIDEILAKRTK